MLHLLDYGKAGRFGWWFSKEIGSYGPRPCCFRLAQGVGGLMMVQKLYD